VVSHTDSGRHSLALKLRGHPSSLLHPGLLAQHMTVPMPLLHDFRKPITVRYSQPLHGHFNHTI
jgi:hypothetical protein